ncbi:CheR family methyltransferase [Pelagicoccus mobilis]|uniref:protein-glutamate O-methyltransferase n=1 Tax=Pelagicoccus mobilis TaxID=415221 RepID=A0A934VPN5_9BACT|nr:protein-glutamate O-methyltransferase [Pelagicoccus mobilis]MBK1877477.1 protein-glutamate O-methyltransferase [Pelagicoccus mobilis]
MSIETIQQESLNLTKGSFDSFSQYITRELGIKMPRSKISMLQGRLRKRVRALGLTSIEDYQKLLFKSSSNKEELVNFIDAVTTNKTDFFRERSHFDTLIESTLPQLERSARKPSLFNLWCAGCSTGEEAYTLAMVLSEYERLHDGFDFSIFATDISQRVLTKAQTAIYTEERIQDIPTELRKRYLLRSRDPQKRIYRIVPNLRSRISFDRLNFMNENYSVSRRFEVIFFRNVMIYFDKNTQEKVVNRLAKRLKPGGFLFVGHSESLAGLDIPFESVGSSIYRKS